MRDLKHADVGTQPTTAGAQQARGTAARSGKQRTVLAVVTVGTFMTTLDASIVNISLPTIAHGFGVALSGTEWH